MRILLYEHISSGGYAGKTIPSSLLCEGYAMLRGLTADFKSAGHKVTVLLDSRIASFNPPLNADCIVKIASSKEIYQSMEKAAKFAEAAYVVAPEAGNILKTIVESMEATEVLPLNCQSKGIAQVSEKRNIENKAKKLDLDTPKAQNFLIDDPPGAVADKISETLGFPAVIKPAIGAGGTGVSVVHNENDVSVALGKINQENMFAQAIAQELVEGVPVSVSMICTENEALPVSLNLQEITLADPHGLSSYNGGTVPFEHPLKRKAIAAAKKIVESFEGLIGYVGVDFVLSNDKAIVIEINPRLTTSYVGLRKVATFNLAAAMLNAVTKKEIPEKPKNKGASCFTKVAVAHSSSLNWRRISKMPAVEAPPFPLKEYASTYALIQVHAGDSVKSSLRLQKIKNRIMQLSKGGAL